MDYNAPFCATNMLIQIIGLSLKPYVVVVQPAMNVTVDI